MPGGERGEVSRRRLSGGDAVSVATQTGPPTAVACWRPLPRVAGLPCSVVMHTHTRQGERHRDRCGPVQASGRRRRRCEEV